MGHSLAAQLVERTASAAFLADRRPQDLPRALDSIGEVAHRLILVQGPDARRLRDAGLMLSGLLGAVRAAHDRLNVPARNQALVEMGRIAARVHAMELLIPLMPSHAVRLASAPSLERSRVTAPSPLAALARIFAGTRPAAGRHLRLIQGGVR